MTQNRAASFQATRRCRGLLWLTGCWLPFLASIDPIGEALATATPNTFSHWLLGENVCTRGAKSTFCEITKYIRREVPVDHSDIREILLIGKIFSFFFFFLWYLRWSFDDNNAEKLVISSSNIVEEYWNSPCRLIHFPFPYIKIKIKIEIQFYRESIYYIS